MPKASIAVLDYDVAFSFAGEDRDYVRPIAEYLRDQGVRVFYDEFETAKLWGTELTESLLDIYQRKARFAVVFISANYVSKPWPRHEGRSALARALVEHTTYFLPVRLDDSELPGLRPTIAYIDASSKTPEQLASIIVEKLSAVPGPTVRGSTAVNAPVETPDEVRSKEQDEALTNAVNRGDDLYIVMDLGGTKAYVSLMTRDAESLYAKKFATQSHNDEDGLLEFIRTCIRGPIDRIHRLTGLKPRDVEQRISAIGIAFPGPTDFATGVALDASNFDIQNLHLADEVHNTFGIATFVDNDVNLGVWGEAWKGAARGHDDVVGIMIGTGIGGGIIINGDIYRGRNKTAGEIGHMILNHDSDIRCGCLQYGCFEALASRKSMARDLHNSKSEQGFSDKMWAEETLLSNEIAWYYKNGDADARAVVLHAAEVCGKAVFSILNLFNPEIIVFNGGFVQQLGDEFLIPVRDEAKKCMNAVYSLDEKKIPIVVGQLPNPVLFGACRMAIEGSGRKVERSKRDIISAIVEQLGAEDWELLDELYRYRGPVPINKHPEGYYHKDRLRTLRNCGLVRTSNSLSFRNANSVEITTLGRIAVEEFSRSSPQT